MYIHTHIHNLCFLIYMEMETRRNYLQSQREDQPPLQGEHSHQENFKASLALFRPSRYQVLVANDNFPIRVCLRHKITEILQPAEAVQFRGMS